MNPTLSTEDIALRSAHDVDRSALRAFYATGILGERPTLPQIWPWLNRTAYHDRRIPLVLEHDGAVIGHAGIIPFAAEYRGRRLNLAWFIDFALLPAYQRKGLGGRLTKAWMDFSDLYVTFCNDKSMGLFKKLGWVESFETYYHRLFLRPFDHPRLQDPFPAAVRATGNALAGPALDLWYRRLTHPLDGARLDPVSADAMRPFLSAPSDAPDASNLVVPVRDADYVDWRVLRSPNRTAYRVFHAAPEAPPLLVGLRTDARPAYLDVLWTADLTDPEAVARALATLARWGRREGFAYIRFYTSNQALSGHLERRLRSTVRHPRYAFYSRDQALFDQIAADPTWNWQLLDSDFEEF